MIEIKISPGTIKKNGGLKSVREQFTGYATDFITTDMLGNPHIRMKELPSGEVIFNIFLSVYPQEFGLEENPEMRTSCKEGDPAYEAALKDFANGIQAKFKAGSMNTFPNKEDRQKIARADTNGFNPYAIITLAEQIELKRN